MKKRVLSMLLAFILCFSTLPMTAFAQETDAVAEQEADSAEEQKEQQGADSAEVVVSESVSRSSGMVEIWLSLQIFRTLQSP